LLDVPFDEVAERLITIQLPKEMQGKAILPIGAKHQEELVVIAKLAYDAAH
jgi:hypothetical protein